MVNGGQPGQRIARGRDMSIELKAWRANMGFSQERAAERLGIGVDVLAKWEGGEPVGLPALIETAIGMPLAPVRFRQ